MTYDLIVIGGGPGGCAAAIKAAQQGASVLLLERGRYPRHRVCGEFVSAEALGLLEGLLSHANRHLARSALKISHSRVFADRSVLHFAIEPPASSVPRFDFDSALWNSCAESGIDARQDVVVHSVEGDGPFTVSAKGEVFQSRALVNAAGRWSFLTSQNTREKASLARWVGVKAHFFEAHASSSVDLYFFEGGYCGVQPVAVSDRDHAVRVINACAMVKADVATELSEVFDLHTALRDRSKTWQRVTEPVSTSPLVFHKPEPARGRIFQVGDAATFVDPFIGDGISLALRSGALAAECLSEFLQCSCSLAQAAEQYHLFYMRRLAPVFRASSLLRNLLRVPSIIRRPAISLLGHTSAVRQRLVRITR